MGEAPASRTRAEAGLTYSIYSHFSMRRHPGPFAVLTFTRVPEVRRVVAFCGTHQTSFFTATWPLQVHITFGALFDVYAPRLPARPVGGCLTTLIGG